MFLFMLKHVILLFLWLKKNRKNMMRKKLIYECLNEKLSEIKPLFHSQFHL